MILQEDLVKTGKLLQADIGQSCAMTSRYNSDLCSGLYVYHCAFEQIFHDAPDHERLELCNLLVAPNGWEMADTNAAHVASVN